MQRMMAYLIRFIAMDQRASTKLSSRMGAWWITSLNNVRPAGNSAS